MGIAKLEQCCCFTLKRGVLIIGIIHIVAYISTIIFLTVNYRQVCNDDINTDYDSICPTLHSNLVRGISGSCFELILMSLMIYGSEKEKYHLMLRIMVLEVTILVIVAIVVGYLTIAAFTISFLAGVFILVSSIAVFGIWTYIMMVFYSRSEEIRNNSHSLTHAPA